MKAADQQIIDGYFCRERVRKLHIGCGGNILKGWLNSDYNSGHPEVVFLDATKPFPFNTDKFDYVFSEHMIEHFDFAQGFAMLLECHRILKPGGKLRISTPDLLFLIDLHREDKSELQKEYIKWSTDNFIKGAPYYAETFVINNFVRDWGHTFIYDENVLRYSLTKAGFEEISKCDVNESACSELKGLENDDRMPSAFLKLESLVLEAAKPRQLPG
jgi:predicted SAM-dependent methyltransferase